jgi:hypothetical protein
MAGHRFTRSFRPDPGEYRDGLGILNEHGRQMDAFLRSCLRSLRRDPDRLLTMLADDWPPARTVGRPRRDDAATVMTRPRPGRSAPT